MLCISAPMLRWYEFSVLWHESNTTAKNVMLLRVAAGIWRIKISRDAVLKNIVELLRVQLPPD
jgi:hypothetical protein